jgi:hypothetical protein
MSNGFPDVALAVLLLKPREAAKALAISPRKLWSLTACGAIRCVRIDRAVRYAPDDLRAYIESLKGGADR